MHDIWILPLCSGNKKCYIVCRSATDLEPLQPVLKKFIAYLEAEALASAMETSTPLPHPDRVSLWVGFKSL